ncbi:BsuPI-related putative proteinase inhibitor [Bacillus sp. 31A1R]|uniref:Intracellular proteinase inhibitor BsuPI domain-containing protein n=1 Tax=Robertmurraya mangrovi TaxID=3098077 RepID=A0ABU5IVQ2_9BACI|nr:BsuPI-related putative proteinase inhibitor [Bacillus sp. 31A1R]MDZ5471221.1 BsuPI-related putative proteinase inhibitor [Bacillus sp. 31A1R]
MKKIWFGLLITIFITGCGTSMKDAEQVTNTNAGEVTSNEVTQSLKQIEPLKYQYEVKNQSEEELTLEFTSSQRYDFLVKNDKGEDVFLFSSAVAFLQALGEEKLGPDQSLQYEIDLSRLNLEPGEYELTLWMTPKEGKKYAISEKIKVE